MCGIAGILSCNWRPNGTLRGIAAEMSAAQANRGPDDRGDWCDAHVGLACVRLAITGSALRGAQPMHSPGGRVTVFNGEIYNAAEIAAELGIAWSDEASDTEALVALLARDGVDGLSRLRGPFAFAHYDPARGRLLLARDGVGKKPLFLAPVAGGWAFASTVRALKPATGPLRLRDEAILEYLVYRSVGGMGSAFRDVVQVPPGGWVELGLDGSRREGRWWSLPRVCDGDLSPREVQDLVSRSVRMRHPGGRPVSVFLSGGLDSAIVAATMARHRGDSDIRALSVGYDTEGYEDETDYAAMLARDFGVGFERVHLTAAEVPALLDDAARLTESPIQDPVTVPTVRLAQRAVEHSKIVLTGDGSDEIWGGYARFAGAPENLQAYLPRTTVFAPEELGLDTPPASYLDGIALPKGTLAPIDRVLRLEVSNRMRNYHLGRVDAIAMGLGLEPRSPFLDLSVVDQGLRLSGAAKCPGGVPKGLLIEAFRGDLPGWLTERRKQPFTVPISKWLAGPLAGFARDTLADLNARIRDVVDPDPWLQAATAVNEPDLPEPLAHQVWSLLQIELWFRGFCREMEA